MGVTGTVYGTQVSIGLVTRNRTEETEGMNEYGKYGTATVVLGRDGEFVVPKPLREHLDIDVGSTVLMSGGTVSSNTGDDS